MRKWLIGLGNEGYEYGFELTQFESDYLAEKLLDEEPTEAMKEFGSQLHSLSVRNRMNMHRNIKSYVITCESNIDLIDLAIEDESIRNLIKEKGNEIRI